MAMQLQEFVMEWEREAQLTQQVFKQLKDEAMGQRIAPDFNTLGDLAWHLAGSPHVFLSGIGLEFEGTGGPGEAAGSAAAVLQTYEQQSEAMLNAIRNQWNDATLQEVRNLFGMDLPVHVVLRLLIQHQVHHRGQMTVLMRQAGLRVPGVYGPSREEWQETSANS